MQIKNEAKLKTMPIIRTKRSIKQCRLSGQNGAFKQCRLSVQSRA